jgi:hypothetical protein
MKPISGALFVLAIAAAVASGATETSAQGLFGGGSSDPKARQKLNLTLSSTEAHDSDSSPPEISRPIGVGDPAAVGFSTTVIGAADYVFQGRQVQVRATGTSSLRYLRQPGEVLSSYYTSMSHAAGVGISARLASRTTLLVNQTATYSPSSLYNLFARPADAAPGEAPPAAPDYAIRGSESRSYGTSMTLTREVTRRISLSAVPEYQHTEATGQSEGRRELNSYGIRGDVSRHFSRNTVAMAGYRYRLGEVGSGSGVTTRQALTERGIEVGVDYARRLSASRQLTLGARFGSTALLLPDSPEEVALKRRFDGLSGQMTLGYDLGRTWRARANYVRGVEYLAGLSEPVSRDSLTASMEGLLTRRINLVTSAGYSNGRSVLNGNRSTFETYTGDVSLHYGLTRVFATYVEYLYYFYDSRGSAPLAPGIPSGLERKGIRAGLTLRVPAL